MGGSVRDDEDDRVLLQDGHRRVNVSRRVSCRAVKSSTYRNLPQVDTEQLPQRMLDDDLHIAQRTHLTLVRPVKLAPVERPANLPLFLPRHQIDRSPNNDRLGVRPEPFYPEGIVEVLDLGRAHVGVVV